MNISQTEAKISNGGYDRVFETLYGAEAVGAQRTRYLKAAKEFQKLYPNRLDVEIFSAPGRSEIGGNHTDHQHGCVLAAAVDLDVIAIVSFREDGVIRLKSEGHDADTVELADLEVKKDEYGTSGAIIRGIAAKFAEMGIKAGGFDAYTTSNVLSGSGLSSSAAFETLVGTILDAHYNGGKAGAIEIAKIGQYAENVYFGKKSGLMDQMVSSVGGFVFIDFADTDKPIIKKVGYDFEKAGCCLCITDTKGSHADLIDDYSAVPTEMNAVAAYFGKPYLRAVSESEFIGAIPELRKRMSDRAVLRAAHFFNDNQNAADEAAALEKGDFEEFLRIVKSSGDSSYKLLQNIYSSRKPEEQGLSVGLWASERVLNGRGAVRVHGGGFAGTIQAFVPVDIVGEYLAEMDRIFGDGSCLTLKVRPVGGIRLNDIQP
ncbi:MAG: galactokinase [Lachnospiraceae bacterium]|nr:galactokinase [Ruminococcus sp.]MCM1274767.1 galactokinase [Lachnospiraceae bacterium]